MKVEVIKEEMRPQYTGTEPLQYKITITGTGTEKECDYVLNKLLRINSPQLFNELKNSGIIKS